jgi:hypothetical protein
MLEAAAEAYEEDLAVLTTEAFGVGVEGALKR